VRPIVVVTGEGVVRWASAHIEVVSGYPADALVGRSIVELLHPDDVAKLAETFAYMAEHRAAQYLPTTFRFRRADGEIRPFEVVTRDLRDDPVVRGLVVTIADVKDRSLLDEVVESVTAGAPLAQTLDGVVRLLDEQLGAPTAIAAEPGPDGFALGVSEQVARDLTGSGAPLEGDSPWAQAAHSRRPVVITDLDGVPARWRHPARAGGAGAVWVWPVEHPATGALAAAITAWPAPEVGPSPGRRVALERAVRLVRLALERHAYESMLLHAARHDPLTGVANRTRFFEQLREVAASGPGHPAGRATGRAGDDLAVSGGTGSSGADTEDEAGRHAGAVLYLDLDGFKAVNDAHGHRVGDLVLQVVTRRIDAAVRPQDLVARFGGDEFAVLCTRVDDGEAEAVADRLIAAVSRPIQVGGAEVAVGLSIGIAFTDGSEGGPPPTVDAIMDSADRALYEVKAAGKGAWRIASLDATPRTD
jgi:diguanylate cyclase (GGDEF)-like protein/PAS domain S-box-containing protein